MNKIFHILKQMINYVPLKKSKRYGIESSDGPIAGWRRRFWETEVAMRATFKAVNDHKQVAVLVPTTVLAQQHYANFKERLNLCSRGCCFKSFSRVRQSRKKA